MKKRLSGRIEKGPESLLHEGVLAPQFAYEREHLLQYYIQIEMAQLEQYAQLHVITQAQHSAIAQALRKLVTQPTLLVADPELNMSDITFAVERYVEQSIQMPVVGWHVDRSRNDLQACAQLMFLREQTLTLADALLKTGQMAHARAQQGLIQVIPGYTHYQAAQVISPGFYMAAIVDTLLRSMQRLVFFYQESNQCPLGAGAMAGLELQWDRELLAERLGFQKSMTHALVAVASRDVPLRLSMELALLSNTLSRFVTDFLCWSSSEYHIMELPDELAGISSAMPQKKNYPILERLRGKTAHVEGFMVDMLFAQRSTAYTNLVEVSKEGSAHVFEMIQTMHLILSLFTLVLQHVRFFDESLQEQCENNWLGCFSLANRLTLHHGIPVRTAHVIVGEFIVEYMRQQRTVADIEASVLERICQEHGFCVHVEDHELQSLFDAHENMQRKSSSGSTHPQQMSRLLQTQAEELARQSAWWQKQREHLQILKTTLLQS